MLKQLLAHLNSRNPAVREEAMREARALPPEDLLQLIAMEVKRYRRKKRIQSIIGLVVFYICVLYGAYTFGMSLWMYLVALGVGLAASAAIGRWNVSSRALQNLLGIIVETDDICFLLPTLRMISEGITSEKQFALIPTWSRVVLMRLLPKLRASDVTDWTREDKKLLLRPLFVLLQIPDVELALITLKALEQVGGEEAIPAVRNLSRYRGEMQPVADAAAACLPYLTANAEQSRQSQSLLRASSAETASSSNVLLRPAATNPEETPSEQLLRPHFSEE